VKIGGGEGDQNKSARKKKGCSFLCLLFVCLAQKSGSGTVPVVVAAAVEEQVELAALLVRRSSSTHVFFDLYFHIE